MHFAALSRVMLSISKPVSLTSMPPPARLPPPCPHFQTASMPPAVLLSELCPAGCPLSRFRQFPPSPLGRNLRCYYTRCFCPCGQQAPWLATTSDATLLYSSGTLAARSTKVRLFDAGSHPPHTPAGVRFLACSRLTASVPEPAFDAASSLDSSDNPVQRLRSHVSRCHHPPVLSVVHTVPSPNGLLRPPAATAWYDQLGGRRRSSTRFPPHRSPSATSLTHSSASNPRAFVVGSRLRTPSISRPLPTIWPLCRAPLIASSSLPWPPL
jgi:hypothetical protein